MTDRVGGVLVDADQRAGESDSAAINRLISKLFETSAGGVVELAPRVYDISKPIVMKSGVILRGQGAAATVLRAMPELAGPVVISINAETLERDNAWFVSEGVPFRFALIDFSIDASQSRGSGAFGAGDGAHFYGKAFELRGVEITGAPRNGLVSVGSARGGQEVWQDQPEAIFDVRISRAGGDGFVMRGPHDSVIRSAIIAICRGRGLAVEVAENQNGACDIDFCHAYATDRVAIDLQAKVKARFLQGDTGRGAGVRITGSDKTFIQTVECFKTRGSTESDYALDVWAPTTQIGLARVRADWGASGVRIAAADVQIGQLDVDGQRNPGGPFKGTENDGTGLNVSGNFAQIGMASVRNFTRGTGIEIAEGTVGTRLSGVTSNCAVHVRARKLQHSLMDIHARGRADGGIEVEADETDRINVVGTRQ